MDEMEQIVHFSHCHMLNLVYIQPNHKKETTNEEEEEEEEEEDEHKHEYDFVAEDKHVVQCDMCKENIYPFHLCYYSCKDCDYSLHKFCAEMPTTLQNHPLHPNHDLTLSKNFQLSDPAYSINYEWTCHICILKRKNFFNYHCSICKFNMDIICATMYEQMMDHPSHPHKLERMSKKLESYCNACGHQHEGTFFHCTYCSWFWINMNCALLPTKLLIQQSTNGNFTHSHPLTLAYSFPEDDRESKFYPPCRVCDKTLYIFLWLYKCDKCQYYVHIDCATSKICRSNTFKNFKDEDHPNLLLIPFPDDSYNLLRHHLSGHEDFIVKECHDEIPNHFIHQHPLVRVDMQTSLDSKSLFLHDPMKKIQLLCDGCVKPITELPFYKCSQDMQHCDFVLHEWCARWLPSEVQEYPGHPNHTLFLLPKNPSTFFGVFHCNACLLPSNGFVYGCTTCGYYVDTNCAFLPKEIIHEAHPGHLLSRINTSSGMSRKYCNVCRFYMVNRIAFHCDSCNYSLHTHCAFLLPKMIRHKYDKHPLSLRYDPAENHPNDYFCEICEEKFDPKRWYYHCDVCAQSIHPSCSRVILQCEQAVFSKYRKPAFFYVNVKFGGASAIRDHPHHLAFLQGMECHGQCKECHEELQYEMMFKCLECEYALHYNCVS